MTQSPMIEREPPYPTETRAKGWRFEIDYEKVEQSSTWSLAAEVPMAQPALLMMWLSAWTQEPCGSLPNDEDVIRAKCRIPVKQWAALRAILMRGWWLASDGRLYHETITKRVLEMLEYRRREAERRGRNRGKTSGVPELSRGTDTGPARDLPGTPPGCPTPEPEPILRYAQNPPTPPAGGKRGRPGRGPAAFGFEEFWAAYPKRVARPAAEKAWERQGVDEPKLERILAAIARQGLAQLMDREGGRYVPHPTTWLNQSRWEDETVVPATTAATPMTTADLARRNPRPAWLAKTGFDNRYVAENEGCYEWNANQFRNGAKVAS